MKLRINLRALDALRGLLALYVLAAHARWLLWIGHREWISSSPAAWELPLGYASALLRFGHEAVLVFFVLSGFFIHLRFAEQQSSSQSVKFSAIAFYKRRWHRLAMPYFAALGLTLLLDVLGRHWFPTLYLAQSGDALLDSNFARKGFSAGAVWPAVFLLPSSLGKDFGSNGPLWSLGFEVAYYAVYPAWLFVRRQGTLAAVGVGLVIGLAGLALSGGGFLAQAASLYPLWLTGAFMAELAVQREAWLIRLGHWLFLAVPLLLVPAFMPALGVCLGLVGGAAMVGWFASIPIDWMQHRFLRMAESLGIRSYTIYICHFPVVSILAAGWIQLHGTRPLHGWLALAGVVVALTVCLMCFHFVERRFLHPRLNLHPSHA